ncbi:MAG TPA: FAD-dependent monooxygenase [Gemmatimonadales bacterium]|jgi:flavin-dependent dehydrogenase|nr:FAD-dependent monooxygenase [Gemmatimonadales bacterium]
MASSTTDSPEIARADVLVAGAGPAGSAVARLLAAAGHTVVVVDRASFPRDKACSEYMSPEAVRILDRLGVVGALEAAGAVPLAGTAVTAADGARLHGRFALAGHRPYRDTGLSVSRRILDHHLVESARGAGALVLERTAVESLLRDDGGIAGAVVRAQDGGRGAIRARLTVGADGLRSLVGRRLGRRRHGALRRVAFVAHVDGVLEMGDSAEMFVGRRGYLGLNPIGGGRTNVALVVPARRAAAARGRPGEFFLEALGDFPGIRERVAGGSLAREVLATGPFAAWSGRVSADGAALVGDAADFFDPFTGEGIYSALRGAELLAEAARPALARPGRVTAASLVCYRRARRRAFRGKWAVERLIGYGMHFPSLFDRAVGRLGRRGLAHTLIGVTADFVPASAVLNPIFLARMLL